jgi:hypothetical protein
MEAAVEKKADRVYDHRVRMRRVPKGGLQTQYQDQGNTQDEEVCTEVKGDQTETGPRGDEQYKNRALRVSYKEQCRSSLSITTFVYDVIV